MRGALWAVSLLAISGLLACGEGGSLPGDPSKTNLPDGSIPDPVPAEQSLWPLSVGSNWLYRITDDQRGVFEKRVEILGEEVVPGATVEAIHVRSIQPHLEEHSWQSVVDGVVVRLREEDVKAGVTVRSTTWNPANVKAIASPVAVDWTQVSVVTERTSFADGSSDTRERTYHWRVLGLNERVETPAGAFDGAIKLERSRPDKDDWVRVYWLVPGVGKVREEGERTEELIQYEIR